jgi:hypothetical protein
LVAFQPDVHQKYVCGNDNKIWKVVQHEDGFIVQKYVRIHIATDICRIICELRVDLIEVKDANGGEGHATQETCREQR